MKNNPIIYYQLREYKNALLIYYAILVVFFGSIAVQMGKDPNGMIGGLDGMTLIFLFILGLNAFKESFRLAMQNGVSRKAYYIDTIKSVLMLSIFMASLDTLLGLGLSQITRYESFFYQVNQIQDQILFSRNFGLALLTRMLLNVCAFHFGLLITIFYYKLTRFWVYVVSISVPLFLFVILPNLGQNAFRGSKKMVDFVDDILYAFNTLFFGTPIKSIASWFIVSVILSVGIYHMIKKTELKKHSA